MDGAISDEQMVWDKLLSGCVAQTLEKLPELKHLVHYTSFFSFKSIVENRELWFNAACNMNDIDEVTHGKRVLLNECHRQGSPIFELFERLRATHSDILQDTDRLFSDAARDDPFDTFISCWSSFDATKSEQDNLSMWRSYAADGNGVAMVIDPIKMGLGSKDYSDIIFAPVRYETDEVFLERAKSALEIYVRELEELTSNEREAGKLILSHALNDVIYYLAVTHKHPQFSPESEWRFIWRKGRAGQKFLDYLKPQLVRNGLYEYFCLPLQSDTELLDAPLELEENLIHVMIGPTDDFAQKVAATRNLLHRCGFKFEITGVSRSSIPYRGR